MQKIPKKSLAKTTLGVTLTLGVSIGIVSASLAPLVGIFGTPHTLGRFSPDGNAGRITIESPGYSVVEDSTTPGNLILDGEHMFLETAGWVSLTTDRTTLTPGGASVSLTPIPSATTITEWTLAPGEELYGWSDTAGWIDFNATDVSSGLIYRGGGLSSFTGHAWSDTLGWLDFSEAIVDFQNKVKVIGSIGGNKAFDIVYNVGSKFNSVSVTTLINTIRKNIGLMTRSVGNDRINTTVGGSDLLNSNTILYTLRGESISNADDLFSTANGTPLRSIIIIGGDLIIDNNINEDSRMKTSRAIIVMKNESGQGGNIYIKDSVKNIYTTLVAEGSVFSGDGSSGPVEKYNDSDDKRETLPSNQLYIYGSVISRNTIGGSQKDPLSCPYTVSQSDCTRNEAAIYDWNYFRTFDKTDPTKRAYKDDTYDDYSIIIEYDSKLIQDPPPGLTN